MFSRAGGVIITTWMVAVSNMHNYADQREAAPRRTIKFPK